MTPPSKSPCLGRQRAHLRAGPFGIAETRHNRGLVLPPHAHEHACIHVVLDGVYQETTCEGSQAFPANRILFKPAGERHWNAFGAGGATTLRIEVDPSVPDVGIPAGCQEDAGLLTVAGRLVLEARHPDDLSRLAAEGLCLELLSRMGRLSRPTSRVAGRDLAEKASRILRERYRERVHFGELARELGVDRSHLARSFRGHFRRTLGEFVRELRVDHVRRALLETNRPLAELALEAGFADQSHCTRVFRRLIGRTPARYRRAAWG